MLQNYIKIAWRNLLRNKVFSLINILGLAIGMAACLLILQYVNFELSYEDFHQDADQIYRITLDMYNGSEFLGSDAATYWPLGPLLREQMPEVLDFVRITSYEVQEIAVGEQQFYEDRIYFADSSIFTIFSYNVLHGNAATALTHPFQTAITASIAQKYFGRTDVVGQSIQVNDDLYEVTAVMEDVPPNTHLKFDLLLSHTTINNVWDWYEKYAWNSNNDYTYLLMGPGTDLARFNEKLTKLSISLKEVGEERFVAEPIKDIHLYSNKYYEPEVNGSAKVVYFLLIIALFILLIAWVNYVNLSTARAVERAREVGIRKVMGSVRGQLITQFLLESLLISGLAAGVSLIFLQVGLPIFRDITGQPLPIDAIADPVFWYLLFALLGVGIVLAGLYPALVLSSLSSTTVLKGNLSTSSHGRWLRKGLVVFQFTATIVLIISTATVYLQIHHLRNQDLGINITQTLALQAPKLDIPDSLFRERFHSFKSELTRHSTIQQVAQSESLPGLSINDLSTSTGITPVGKDEKGKGYMYYINRIDADFLTTMDVQLIAGRNFDAQMANSSQLLINEEAVQWLGFTSAEEAIGSQITDGGTPLTIIGVIKNYRQRSPKEKHIPMIFPYTSMGDYFTIRLNTSQIRGTVAIAEAVWQKVFPNSAFDYFFLDEKYNQQYRADTQFGLAVGIFSTLAIFIACLGLFGLSSYTIVQRTKEIGIRKVMGASITQIVRLLSKDFARLVFFSSLLAVPIAYFTMREWLGNYATRISLSWWLFLLPLAIVLCIALLTISIQTIRAALANPVESLRYE